MLNTPTMIPSHLFASGHSMNWHYVAYRIAQKSQENCSHMEPLKILIKMSPLTNEAITGITFDVTCGVCSKKLEDTSLKLSAKFIKFYGK